MPKTPATIPIDQIVQEPYASVVCYPRASPRDIAERIVELKLLGVEAVEFSGQTALCGLPILGKGYVGVVAVAHVRGGGRVALKMRRVDADRVDLMHEAEMLKKANTVKVGPKFVAVSKNFLLSQLVDGGVLAAWLETHKEKEAVRMVLVDVLEQCWRLDEAGLDHGELSKAPKHVIIDHYQQPWIVDFETSSDTRKPANVTAICQYLIMSGGPIPRTISEILGEWNCDTVIEALRHYKKEKSRENLDRLMQVCLF